MSTLHYRALFLLLKFAKLIPNPQRIDLFGPYIRSNNKLYPIFQRSLDFEVYGTAVPGTELLFSDFL